MKRMTSKALSWLKEHERQLLSIIGIIIITILSYVFGTLHGAQLSQKPIIVTRPDTPPVLIKENTGLTNTNITPEECIYVGSIKGKKYYPPSCSYAKNIAKENLRCFKSDQDAIDKGYTKSTSCK